MLEDSNKELVWFILKGRVIAWVVGGKPQSPPIKARDSRKDQLKVDQAMFIDWDLLVEEPRSTCLPVNRKHELNIGEGIAVRW